MIFSDEATNTNMSWNMFARKSPSPPANTPQWLKPHTSDEMYNAQASDMAQNVDLAFQRGDVGRINEAASAWSKLAAQRSKSPYVQRLQRNLGDRYADRNLANVDAKVEHAQISQTTVCQKLRSLHDAVCKLMEQEDAPNPVLLERYIREKREFERLVNQALQPPVPAQEGGALKKKKTKTAKTAKKPTAKKTKKH
jgi:hypothetical protein